jgi:transcriptional regulator with XRE-family HTH domain
MVDQDLRELRGLLREAVEASRMQTRDIEKALGIGHGNLARLLKGTLELRIRHLLAFARLLNIPPADFLELGCPEASRNARRRLLDWLGPDRRESKAVSRLPATTQELTELIRVVVSEELDAREVIPVRTRPPRR